MLTIQVQMKRGGFLPLEASGRCYTDTDGAGQSFEVVEDLELYWPSRRGAKKLYPVKPELVADWAQVEEAYAQASQEAYQAACVDAALDSYDY